MSHWSLRAKSGVYSCSMVKNPLAKQEAGLIPGSGRSLGEGNGNSLQNSCLVNPMDRGACLYSSWVENESDMT